MRVIQVSFGGLRKGLPMEVAGICGGWMLTVDDGSIHLASSSAKQARAVGLGAAPSTNRVNVFGAGMKKAAPAGAAFAGLLKRCVERAANDPPAAAIRRCSLLA
jgi:hypothetical protein